LKKSVFELKKRHDEMRSRCERGSKRKPRGRKLLHCGHEQSANGYGRNKTYVIGWKCWSWSARKKRTKRRQIYVVVTLTRRVGKQKLIHWSSKGNV